MSNSAAETTQPSNVDPKEAARLDPGHGNTIAGWSAVFIMLAGFIVGAVGFLMISSSYFWLLVGIGAAIVIVGLIVGLILKIAGFGVGGHRTTQH